MITTKQRAKLRSLANTMQTTMQIGKDGVKVESLKQMNDLFQAREMFKINILKNADTTAKDIAKTIEEKTGCEVVQVVGNKIVVYKRSTKKDAKHIELD